ncbi:peptidase inhibitor family I36 protein [Micromonosporaceae bacterium Da 78-11]
MIRKIGAALAIAAGAFAAVGVAAPANASNGDKIIDAGEVVVWKDPGFVGQFYDFGTTSPATYPSATVPSFDNCANLAGWFVNPDETTRKPEATAAGLKFEPADLIHRNVTGVTTDTILPGTYAASPAPDQSSFFSVEVDSGTAGTYGTLRWNPTTSKWSMVANGGQYFESASANAVVDHFSKSHTVVRFGVGYTQTPPGTVTTVVSSVTFNGTTFPLTCTLPAFGTAPGTLTAIDNNTSSIVNYSSSYVRAYADSNYQGAYIQLLPYGQTNGTLSYAYSGLGSLNDSLSSHKVGGP